MLNSHTSWFQKRDLGDKVVDQDGDGDCDDDLDGAVDGWIVRRRMGVSLCGRFAGLPRAAAESRGQI